MEVHVPGQWSTVKYSRRQYVSTFSTLLVSVGSYSIQLLTERGVIITSRVQLITEHVSGSAIINVQKGTIGFRGSQ